MDPAVIGATIAAVPILAAIAALAVRPVLRKRKRRLEAMRAIDIPGSRRDVALILAMGGDPQKHRIVVVRGHMPGLRLVDDDNRPVRFMSKAQLGSAAMRAKYKAAERTISLVIEGA